GAAVPGDGPRLRWEVARLTRRPTGAGDADAQRHRSGAVVAVVERSVLDEVRRKIDAGERLEFEDGLAILESDDLLLLGELADLARRLRGGTDDVYFVQNLYLNQTNVCRVKCKFCAFG